MITTNKNPYACKNYGKLVNFNSKNVYEPIDLLDVKVYDLIEKRVVSLGEVFEKNELQIQQLQLAITSLTNELTVAKKSLANAILALNEKVDKKGII